MSRSLDAIDEELREIAESVLLENIRMILKARSLTPEEAAVLVGEIRSRVRYESVDATGEA